MKEISLDTARKLVYDQLQTLSDLEGSNKVCRMSPRILATMLDIEEARIKPMVAPEIDQRTVDPIEDQKKNAHLGGLNRIAAALANKQ